MLFSRQGRVLLVSPYSFSVPVLTGKKQVWHVTSLDRVFPTMHEMVPDTIIFNYDHFSEHMEKILIRIRNNKFYNKTKIFCYKNSPDHMTDYNLKELGVNGIYYKSELGINISPTNTQNNSDFEHTTREFEPALRIFEPSIKVLTVNG